MRSFFIPSHFPCYTSFTASQPRKNGRCLAKKSQNSQFATFNLGCKNFARRKIFSSPAISHVTRLLRRPNHAKMAIAWPKTVKTHNLQRLVWAAKSSHGANFFHPSHFPRYTSFTSSQSLKDGRYLAKNSQNSQIAKFNLGCKKSARLELFSSQPFPTLHNFTASQPRKNGRCLAKKSQNSQIAKFNLGCKKSARRELFSSPAISHVTRPLRRPNHAKLTVACPKTVKTHNLPRLNWAAKRSRGAIFFHPRHFPRYTSFTAPQPRKNGRGLAKNSQNTQFATFNLGCKKSARRKLFFIPAIFHVTRLLRRPNHAKMAVAWPKKFKTHNLPRLISASKSSRGSNFFSSQPFSTLHVFYGVPTTQKWPSLGQKNSKHTICHV